MAVIQSGDTADLLSVDGNKAAKVSFGGTPQTAGFIKLLDSDGREIVTTENGALSTSIDQLLFVDQVDGSAVNTNKWIQSTSGMTIAQANGFITLNSGAATTANAYAILSSIKNIPLYGHLPVRISINAKVPIQPQSNLVIEMGIGSVATTAAPTDGCIFRWNSSAQFQVVDNNGGSETAVALSGTFTEADGASITLPPTNGDTTLFDLVMVEDVVQFFVDDVLVDEIDVATGFSYPTNSGRLPIFFRVYNGGSSPAQAPQISVGQVVAVQEGVSINRPWRESLVTLGQGAYQSPVTPFAQTANHANSTSPISATLSNTAAGYTTLGGRYQFAAVAGAATDFALFAYQVPAGYQLFIYGVAISCTNTGAIGSIVTPTLVDWSLGVNSSAVSLATADGAGIWAPRRIPLGMQTFGLSAFIGAQAPDIMRTLLAVVDGGRYCHIIVQVPVGAATGSQIFRGDVFIDGYLE